MTKEDFRNRKGFLYYEDIQELTIRTHFPDKWRFVDLETGEIWAHDKTTHMFKRVERSTLDKELSMLERNES